MPETDPNPLLAAWDGPCGTPDFAAIRAEHFLPAFAAGIEASRAEIAAITGNPAAPDFDNVMAALERSGDGWLTTTRLHGATYLRAGIVNYLSTEADIDRLLATLRRLAS